jgi:uncharacterized membrane-anchored protein
MRTGVIFGGLVLVVVALTSLVVRKEAVLTHGKTVLLELAPVDPRSLMQGDYMILDYVISRELQRQSPSSSDGRLVLRLDELGVGRLVRVHDAGTPLQPEEFLLRYRMRHNYRIRLGAEAFFFQEGHAERYARAKYGELRVQENGDSVLVGLRDAERRPLGKSAHLAAGTPQPAVTGP